MDFSDWRLYGLFAFFSTLCVYNVQRLFKITRYKRTPWLLWVNQNRLFLIILIALSACGAATTFLLLSHFSWFAMLSLILAGCIAFFYVVRVGQGQNLRDIPYLKIHLIALTWTLVLILFPMLNEGKTEGLAYYALAHYAYVLAITIPFDIRDLKYDEPRKCTIPQVLGVQGAKMLGITLLGLFLCIMWYVTPSFFENPVLIVAVLVQIGLVLGMSEKRSDMYCAGAIDGAIALLGLAYFFG